MAWDASRPVPWRRMVREWLIYVAIMAVLFLVFFRDSSLIGVFAGLLASGPLYLLFGYALAKLGYQRKTLAQVRAASTEAKSGSDTRAGGAAPPRPRPAPTKRTGGGGQGGGQGGRRGGRPGGARRR